VIFPISTEKGGKSLPRKGKERGEKMSKKVLCSGLRRGEKWILYLLYRLDQKKKKEGGSKGKKERDSSALTISMKNKKKKECRPFLPPGKRGKRVRGGGGRPILVIVLDFGGEEGTRVSPLRWGGKGGNGREKGSSLRRRF